MISRGRNTHFGQYGWRHWIRIANTSVFASAASVKHQMVSPVTANTMRVTLSARYATVRIFAISSNWRSLRRRANGIE